MKVESITTLKRQITKILSELRASKEAALITARGQRSAYLVDVDDYEAMNSRISLLEGLVRGESAFSEGCVMPHAQAKERMSKWLK